MRNVLSELRSIWGPQPSIGERGRRSMRKKKEYTDEPMGELRMVKDFLPSPDQLVLKGKKVKGTIPLSRESCEKPLPVDTKKCREGNRDDVRG